MDELRTPTDITHEHLRAASPWEALGQIWRRNYPPERPRAASTSLIVQLAVTPVLIVRGLSPSRLVSSRFAKNPSVIDAMVLGWTALTTLLLFLPRILGSPAGGGLLPRGAVLLYVWFRVIDVAAVNLNELLVHSIRERALFAGIQRSLLLTLVNIWEIVACFAVLYLADGGVCSREGCLSGAWTAFYFSAVTGVTVGYGDYVPVSQGSQMLVLVELSIVLLLIFAWFPAVTTLLFPYQPASTVRPVRDRAERDRS
jgi:hypothetical protein